MNEVRVFGALLAVLLVGAYLSWTSDDDSPDTSAVTLWDLQPDALERIELVTTTQTVAFSFRGDDRLPWFEVTKRDRTQTFVGSEQTETLVKRFAPFEALRSLGRSMGPEELDKAGLARPQRRLQITGGGKSRRYLVGNRTNGRRDHYIKTETSDEVYLVASATLGDLELSQSKYMQRRLLVKPLEEIAAVTIAANGQAATFTHRNRDDRKAAVWTAEDEQTPLEEVGSFMLKLSRLTVRKYPEDQSVIDKATPVLELSWKDEAGALVGATSLYRVGDGDKAKYFGKSDRTVLVGEVSRGTAAQLEKDLATVFGR